MCSQSGLKNHFLLVPAFSVALRSTRRRFGTGLERSQHCSEQVSLGVSDCGDEEACSVVAVLICKVVSLGTGGADSVGAGIGLKNFFIQQTKVFKKT